MQVSYPGIVSVGYLFADNLPANTMYHAQAGIPISLFLRPDDIPLSGTPDLIVESTNESNGTAESMTLTFSSTLRLPRLRAVAFVIKDANGQWWLIGQLEKPHPAVTGSKATGATDGEPAVTTYEVRQTAPICLKPCKMMV